MPVGLLIDLVIWLMSTTLTSDWLDLVCLAWWKDYKK